jgi:hypothetical protein
LADTLALGASAARHGGSSPLPRTIVRFHNLFDLLFTNTRAIILSDSSSPFPALATASLIQNLRFSMPKTILILEPDQAIRQMMEMALKKHGYFPIPTEIRATAEDLLKNVKIDAVVVSDTQNNGTGVGFADSTKKKYPAKVVILMCGYSKPEMPPGVEYAAKPFTPSEIVNQIEMLMLRNRQSEAPEA